MINTINQLLNSYQYKLSENKYAKSWLLSDMSGWCENYIEIVVDSEMEIYEVHRNDRILIIKTSDQIHAGVYASVLWLRMFKPRKNTFEINKIYHYAKLNKQDLIDDFLSVSLNSEYFLIGYEDAEKICLIKEQKKYSLRYSNIQILETANMAQGYIALFNYTRMLEFVRTLYDEQISVIDKSVNKNKIIYLYLSGREKSCKKK